MGPRREGGRLEGSRRRIDLSRPSDFLRQMFQSNRQYVFLLVRYVHSRSPTFDWQGQGFRGGWICISCTEFREKVVLVRFVTWFQSLTGILIWSGENWDCKVTNKYRFCTCSSGTSTADTFLWKVNRINDRTRLVYKEAFYKRILEDWCHYPWHPFSLLLFPLIYQVYLLITSHYQVFYSFSSATPFGLLVLYGSLPFGPFLQNLLHPKNVQHLLRTINQTDPYRQVFLHVRGAKPPSLCVY